MIVEGVYKEWDTQLISINYIYWKDIDNKLKVLKARIDCENKLKEMHKQIFYPLIFNYGKMNIINREEP